MRIEDGKEEKLSSRSIVAWPQLAVCTPSAATRAFLSTEPPLASSPPITQSGALGRLGRCDDGDGEGTWGQDSQGCLGGSPLG